MDNLHWMDLGNCTSGGEGALVSIFFPEVGGSGLPAKSICAGCSVSKQCLDYAYDPAIFSAERHMGSVRVRAAVVLHMGSAAVVLHGATVEIVPWPQAGA